MAFAILCAAAPNFLILDEPTNHLDIQTIEALGNALLKYKVSLAISFVCLFNTSDTISTELIRLDLISLRNLLPMAGIFNQKCPLQILKRTHFP